MSLIWGRQQRDLGDTPNQLIPPRGRGVGTANVTTDSALKTSAFWACLRLRADLISTMPLGTFRQVGDLKLTTQATPFFLDPGGDGYGLEDWLYSSQMDLDRSGNVFGVIKAVDAMGKPAVIELVQRSEVVVKGVGPTITGYRIGRTDYTPDQVWHERQFTVPGVPLGLSLVAYAAATIGQYMSGQQFGIDWFANGRIPAAALKNTAKTIDAGAAKVAKERFKAAVENRDLFVHGADWEYNMIAVNDGESQFIDLQRFGVLDIARYCGIPGDLIDAEAQSSAKITYANISQRNLQLLVMNLLPTLVRRERRLSNRALPRPRFVEFQPDSTLLRMDPSTRAAVEQLQIAARIRTPDELRALANLQPFTEVDYAQFDRLFGKSAPDATPRTGVPQ